MERGGTTTQSGILYQNSVSALFLGRLIDTQVRPKAHTVIRVRVESPDHVDDVVVTYADGHREYYQVKESLDLGASWKKLWQDFRHQCCHLDFRVSDRVVLACSNSTDIMELVRNLALRASTSSSTAEWMGRLSRELVAFLGEIRDAFSPQISEDEVFEILKKTDVECFGTLEQIERERVAYWLPESSSSKDSLFRLLRDAVGGKARVRGEFSAPGLLEILNKDHGVLVVDQLDDVTVYQDALRTLCGQMAIPGCNLAGPTEEIFVWPKLFQETQDNQRYGVSVNVDEADMMHLQAEVSLDDFPKSTIKSAVIVAGAGFGKSSLLRAVAIRLLSNRTWVPAIVSLPELAASGLGVAEYLMRKTRQDFNCQVKWDYYLQCGRAVLLFDGLDEVHGQRATLLRQISAFVGRYQDLAWLLAVRDAAAVSVPLGVPFIRIGGLEYEQAHQLVEAYRKHGGQIKPEALFNRWFTDSEFRRLASVPFFLALLVATSRDEADLGRGRTLLLKRYIHMVLHPEIYRTDTSTSTDPGLLLAAAELLATEGLERSSFLLAEGDAHLLLRERLSGAETGTVIKDLAVCGLIRPASQWVSFVFPSVQEFLAASALSRQGIDAVIRRFSLLRHRPWAQTVQYAIEQLPDATEAVSRLLEHPEDAYWSILRMVGRCVVHGASVSPPLRQLIGDRLADVWLNMPTYRLKDEVGGLLADAYVSALPLKVLEHLKRGRGLHSGGGRLVSLRNDPMLTLDVLDAVLRRDLKWLSHLHDLQPAVNAVASLALERYVLRAENTKQAAEIESLASLISRLDISRLDRGRVRQLREDSKLPLLIRLGLACLDADLSDAEAVSIANEILHLPPTSSPRGWPPGMRLALGLLVRSHNPVSNMIECLRQVPDKLVQDLLYWVLNDDSGNPNLITRPLLDAVEHRDEFASSTKHTVRLCKLYLGEVRHLSEMLSQLDDFEEDELRFFVLSLTRLNDRDLIRKLIEVLDSMSAESRAAVSSVLGSGMRYHLEAFDRGWGWSARAKAPHPAIHFVAETLNRWAQTQERGKRLNLLAEAAELGHSVAGQTLLVEMEDFIALELEDKDNTVTPWLRALTVLALNPRLDVLTKVARRKGCHNDARDAVDAIARHGTSAALDEILKLRREDLDEFVHEAIEEKLLELSGKFGLTVDRDEEGYPFIRDPER